MLARGVLCRLAADAPKTTPHDLPHLARILRRTLLARNASSSPAVRALSRAFTSAIQARRTYATATSATQPTETVKKAVKAVAAKKTAPKKKPAAATKSKRKTVAKKKPTKKAAPKKKATPPKRVKKVLSAEAKEKATIAALRKAVLREPVTNTTLTGLNIYVAEQSAGKCSGRREVVEKLVAASHKWKTLTPAEHEHYNHLANEKTAAQQAEYQAWIKSHTAEEIRLANNARLQLRKKLRGTLKKKYPAYTSRLIDDRAVKRPTTAYVLFQSERWQSGDMKGIKVADASKLIANEWKALSASEKKKYEDAELANKEKYKRDRAAL